MEIKETVVTKVVRYIEYDGIKFYPDQRGYWLGNLKGLKRPIRLHTYVWEKHNGKVPDGYHVHHIDHNPDNNDIPNLQLMSKHEHLTMHSNLQDKEWARRNLNENARPKAIEWHKSAEGRKWHSEMSKKHIVDLVNDKVTLICQFCGNEYQVPKFISEGSRFCSANCKSAWRRKSGIDNIEVSCEICGKLFFTNKYSQAKFCSPECRLKNPRRRGYRPQE